MGISFLICLLESVFPRRKTSRANMWCMYMFLIAVYRSNCKESQMIDLNQFYFDARLAEKTTAVCCLPLIFIGQTLWKVFITDFNQFYLSTCKTSSANMWGVCLFPIAIYHSNYGMFYNWFSQFNYFAVRLPEQTYEMCVCSSYQQKKTSGLASDK